MIELFANIPKEVKEQTEVVANFVFLNFEPEPGLKFIQSYISSCEDEDERDFVRFYFNTRLEQLLEEGESNEY